MNAVLWVFIGGGLGTAARFLVTGATAGLLGQSYPVGTFLVNLLGSFVVGVLSALLISKLPGYDSVRLFAVTGFLGGFTTYSAYALDVVTLMHRGENLAAITYAIGTMVTCVLACLAGLALSRLLLT